MSSVRTHVLCTALAQNPGSPCPRAASSNCLGWHRGSAWGTGPLLQGFPQLYVLARKCWDHHLSVGNQNAVSHQHTYLDHFVVGFAPSQSPSTGAGNDTATKFTCSPSSFRTSLWCLNLALQTEQNSAFSCPTAIHDEFFKQRRSLCSKLWESTCLLQRFHAQTAVALSRSPK